MMNIKVVWEMVEALEREFPTYSRLPSESERLAMMARAYFKAQNFKACVEEPLIKSVIPPSGAFTP